MNLLTKDWPSSSDLGKIQSLKTWWKRVRNWTVYTVYAKGWDHFVIHVTLPCLVGRSDALVTEELVCLTCWCRYSRYFCPKYSFVTGNNIFLHLYLKCVLLVRSFVQLVNVWRGRVEIHWILNPSFPSPLFN